MAKLATKTANVLKYLQENDKGEGVPVEEIAEALSTAAAPLTKRNIIPTVTLSLGRAPKDGSRGVLATYEKRAVEGVEGDVGFAVLTDEGAAFDFDAEDAE